MLNYVTSSFVTLALVIDPIGLAPAFIALTQDLDAVQKRALALRSSAIAAAILIVTALLGNWFLAQLRIGLAAFQISGGILLFGVATRMIFGEHVRQQSRDAESAAREKIASCRLPARDPADRGSWRHHRNAFAGEPRRRQSSMAACACRDHPCRSTRIGSVVSSRRPACTHHGADGQYRAGTIARHRTRRVRHAVRRGRN